MNAILTWWGVSVAILNHGSLGNALVGRETLLQVVPAFVAVLVWLIRVLVIGTLITAGGKLFAKESTARSMPPTMRRNNPSGNRVAQPAMRQSMQPGAYKGLVPQGSSHVDQSEF
jgi:hypothetical protein